MYQMTLTVYESDKIETSLIISCDSTMNVRIQRSHKLYTGTKNEEQFKK